ncbi:MAG TPA: AMP-binding protein [Dermatophilaceae bacterium]|nr:AMP-binding protein [Dermatophilaceae bacterium]
MAYSPDTDAPLRWSIDELRAHQLERLQDTVRRCYEKVPHYRKAFDERGVHPDDIRELSDIAKLPFTDKITLRDNYPFGMFAVPRSETVRVHASSGTTGKPTVVGYTQADMDRWSDLIARCLWEAGARPGMAMHNLAGYGLFTGGLGIDQGAMRLGLSVVPVSGGMTERQIQLIQDFEPQVIHSTPSYFLTVLDAMEDNGIDPKQTSMRIGIFGAEPWTHEMRNVIESRTSMRAFDMFGLSELIGPGVASETDSQDGLTIWEDHFYPEIIHPDTHEPVADGQPGELVFTSLTKEAFPVLRYRTKDLSTLQPGTTFPQFRHMAKVTGRTDDMMIIRGVNVFPTQIEEIIVRHTDLTPTFQCVLTQPGNMVELTVLVESHVHLEPEQANTVAHDLQREIKDRVGTTAKVEVRDPGGIERSVGKARRIVDKRG